MLPFASQAQDAEQSASRALAWLAARQNADGGLRGQHERQHLSKDALDLLALQTTADGSTAG